LRAASLTAALLACGCTSRTTVTIPYEQTFDRQALGAEWSSTGGQWSVVEGRLFNDGAHNVPLWLSASLPRDVRVTFEAESKSEAVDIKAEIFGDGRHHQSGYVVILAGWNNSKSIIARLDEHGAERTDLVTAKLRAEVAGDPDGARARHRERREIIARHEPMLKDHVYHVKIERRDNELRFFADGVQILSYFDPSPLSGRGHDRFAFNNWASRVYFDNLRIEPL
jgi:hypothetical protein